MVDAAAVSVDQLVKDYDGSIAVNGISFDISRGETFALLGPNGAGKTTTIEILEGYRKRSSGSASVLGYDPGRNARAFRERIGLVLQSTALEPELTVQETLTAFAEFYPSPAPVAGLLTTVGLADQGGARVRTLSGGQQRRLEIALGLVGDPDVVFLDEPTTGLDPDARNGIWSLIRDLSARGKTVILTSHYMEEVEALADRLAIMVAGKVCAIGSVADVISEHGGNARISFAWPHDQLPDDLPPLLSAAQIDHDGKVSCEAADPAKALSEMISWAPRRKFVLDELTVSRPSLEDIYLSIVERYHSRAGDGT